MNKPYSNPNLRPVLFLDIDGVIVLRHTLSARRGSGLQGEIVADRGCIKELNRITESTNGVIVLSSAWRFCGLLEMQAIARLWGITAPLVDLMPDYSTRLPNNQWNIVERWKEIQGWLQESGLQMSYVILDDITDMGELSANHIRTDAQHGLTHTLANAAIHVLNSTPAGNLR